jgi:hypothetical protein
MGMEPEADIAEVVGLMKVGLGVEVSMVTMIGLAGLQDRVRKTSPSITKSFLGIILFPYLSLSLRN